MSSQEFSKAFEYYRAKRYQEAYDIWSKMTDDNVALYNAALVLYNQQIKVGEHWGTAYNLFLESAWLGRKESYFFCGDIVERGLVGFPIKDALGFYYRCPPDSKVAARAFDRIKHLAENDNADAQGMLAYCHYWGTFTEKNTEEAFKWAKRGYENGERFRSAYLLALMEKDHVRLFGYFLEAANSGNRYAAPRLGECYYFGKGTSKNYTEAIRWFNVGVDLGDVYSMYYLGKIYLDGLGCNANPKRAELFFQNVIADINAPATCICNIGIVYYRGKKAGDTSSCLEKNIDLAIRLLRRATALGSEKASYVLSRAYYCGEEVAQDYRLAFHYASKAENYPEGAYVLGLCYYFGHGCKKNPELAKKHFMYALQHGVKQADDYLLDGKALKPYSQWKIEVDGADWLGQVASNIISSLFSGGDD